MGDYVNSWRLKSRESSSPIHSSLHSWDELLSRSSSPLIRGCHTFASGPPDRTPTPLVRVSKRCLFVVAVFQWSGSRTLDRCGRVMGSTLDATENTPSHFLSGIYKDERRENDFMKNRWNAGIFTITNRSVSDSECGPVCDLKTVTEVSRNGRCYPTTSIKWTKSHNPSPRPISGNKRTTSEGQYCQSTAFGAHSRHGNTNFETHCLQETQSCCLYSRRPAACIPLTSAHKRARLNWILKHQHWSVGEWANVMFSDESRFSLNSDSRRLTIWREHGTRFEPRHITERHHFPSRGVMVGAGIMMDSRTDLHFFYTRSVTAQRYRNEVLEPYVRLFRGAVGPDFIFMDDNAPCHQAVLIDDFLEMENIQRMSWLANSPDLNPIEHVWNMIGRQIAALSHPPSSVTELKRALQEAWNRFSPQLIHHLIASMANHWTACLAVRGDHTPY
ncbi:transposable element Tcb2 transposase [Trichonephila clavipes]|nr:transposable element Tcb2 transposase [Trichonephila clavipes]